MKKSETAVVFLSMAALLCAAADWPQLACNPQKTACAPEGPRGPFEFVWDISLIRENDRISSKVQVIIYGDRCYFGSRKGVLWCVNATTGGAVWKKKLGERAGIDHSAGAAAGLVFQGALDHHLYALNADSGELAWKKDFGSGISTAPLIVNGRIFIGTRKGAFFALDQKTGNIAWQRDIGHPILQSAAYDNGRIFVGAEDCRLYCLEERAGGLVWRTQTMNGQSLRGYHPVVVKGKVFVGQGVAWSGIMADSRYPGEAIPLPHEFDFVLASWKHMDSGFSPKSLIRITDAEKEYRLQNCRYLRMLTESPVAMGDALPEAVSESVAQMAEKRRDYGARGGVMVFDAETGAESYVWGGFGTQNMGDTIQPPAVTGEGLLVHTLTVVEHPADLGLFNPQTGGLMGVLLGAVASHDETMNFSAAGGMVFAAHSWEQEPFSVGSCQAWDLENKKHYWIPLRQMPTG